MNLKPADVQCVSVAKAAQLMGVSRTFIYTHLEPLGGFDFHGVTRIPLAKLLQLQRDPKRRLHNAKY